MLCFQEAQLNEVLSASTWTHLPSQWSQENWRWVPHTQLLALFHQALHCLHCKWWKASRWLWLYTLHKLFMSYYLQQDVLDSKNSAIRDLQYELARVCKVRALVAVNCLVWLTHIIQSRTLSQIVSCNFARQNLGWKVWVWGTILVYYLLVASFPGCSRL